ncbi:hypothetical protein DBR33_00720 [Stenotrophomonas sp. HMWF022]|uniref:zinc ribbon domain-containing protein n=1 Tax=Stenotrophomonas sp. HMWF023 TaxID=2056859 RepID=UPI000D3C41A9|nr:zinc ribbon domain-containing protein [Stenotrophomonas sp. HMWF023]PTS71929.1 hypothetical protein DBR20_20925 [Stenotrophomonas sp. HMWF023]PTT58466.1 hypothetical protein DBR33_00720 [Stenotrophomonas sp. HMWF022]
MALISCVECGRQVSDQAEACPNCGHPVRPEQPTPPPIPDVPAAAGGWKRGATGCAVVVAFVVILAVVASCLPSANRAGSASTSGSSAPLKETQDERRSRLLAEAKDETRYPSSRLITAQELARDFPDTEEGKFASGLVPRLQEEARKANLGKQWHYLSSNDPMTSKASLGAVVLSSNTHEFAPPYSKPQNATLTLRKHPQHGSDVILGIERGQLLCTSYSGCEVLVRFGESEAKTYKAYGPDDNSSQSLFIQGYADFLRRMQAVDTVRVQAGVYQEGLPTWEFDVSGFNPDKMK